MRRVGLKEFRMLVRKVKPDIKIDDREDVVNELGFASFAEYKKSAVYSQVRKKVLSNKKICSHDKCCRKPERIHFAKFIVSAFSGEDTSTILYLCVKHYNQIKRAGRNKKRYDYYQKLQKAP